MPPLEIRKVPAGRKESSSAPPEAQEGVTLGIIGGGQLAKMTAQAAAQLGCRVVILERQTEFPAGHVAARTLTGDWDDPQALLGLAAEVDAVTLENEFVDTEALAALEDAGITLWPSAATMRLIQDKYRQKRALADAGIAVPEACAVASLEEVRTVGASWGLPLLLKARRNAYDGKGNATVRAPAEMASAWERLGGGRGNGLFVERFCPFVAELAVIVARAADGSMVTYPVVETQQRDHVCHTVRLPALVPPQVAARADALARRAAEIVGMVGSMGVELFLTGDGELLVNELAPRVHNSGHYTIEACVCSQFENHVRAVLGWPLGSPALRAPAAAMVNLLGTADGSGQPRGLVEALGVPGANVHLYGKTRSGVGRKMGHVTALGGDPDMALALAQRAAASIHFST
jgi:5-(carboxyamino)imidazole ribonucleotide synthase